MATPQLPSRAAVDAAGDLDFDARRKSAEPATITAHVTFSGIHFEVCFNGLVDQLPALARRLVALGAESVSAPAGIPNPVQAANGSSKAKMAYADDGTPLCGNANCSRHGKPMAPSQHGEGFFCRGKDTVTGNAKNYCKSTAD